MLDPNIGQAGFRIGMYIVLVAGILSFVTEPDTAERVISQITLIMGVIFLIVIAVLVKIGR